MILRSFYSPAVLLLSTALVATSALSQTTHSPAAPAQVQTATPATQGAVVEDIVVRVNDQIISRSDYERADQQLQAEIRRANVASEAEGRRRDLLRDLIDQQLLLSKGKELGITGEAELVKQLDEIRKQNHLDSMEDLEKAAQTQGVSFEDFKQSQRNAIITQSVVREEVGRHIQLSQADAQRFYEAHKAEFDQPESVRLSEILVPTAEGDDPAKVAAAEAKANDIYAQLKGGSDFAKLAQASSGGPTAQQGGDLGSFRRGALAKPLEDQTFLLNAGQNTAPIRTKQGFVILKVTEHVQGGLAPMKDVEQQVEEGAFMERMQPSLRVYLTKLREEAFIDIKPGYVDTGGSANQTKPIYSAYTPPASKKKKKAVTTRYRQATHKRSIAPTTATAAEPGGVAGSPGSSVSAAAGAQATTTASATKANSTTATMKPGKKEKIRFGQAPRETLPASTGETEHIDAGAPVAAAPPEMAAVQEPSLPAPAVPEATKTRYSDRAKLPKVKKTKGPKPDPFAPPPITSDETATQKTQAAPLGLSGDTSKKPKKPKSTGEKVRYSDKPKAADVPAPAAPAPTPSPAATTMPAPPPVSDQTPATPQQ